MATVNRIPRYVDQQEAQAIAEEVQSTLERRQVSESSACGERERVSFQYNTNSLSSSFRLGLTLKKTHTHSVTAFSFRSK